jgi:hypothetical protein
MSNPSVQCSVCGKWMRLHGKDDRGHAIQRFYPCCGENGEYDHEKPVCYNCCKTRCPYGYKDKVVISYEYNIAPDRLEPWMWTAKVNGEAIDYHKKEVLIANAKRKGLKWVVIEPI